MSPTNFSHLPARTTSSGIRVFRYGTPELNSAAREAFIAQMRAVGFTYFMRYLDTRGPGVSYGHPPHGHPGHQCDQWSSPCPIERPMWWVCDVCAESNLSNNERCGTCGAEQ